MTGYASGHSTVSEAAPGTAPAIGMEIRSVNSRFLDLGFRLSDELRTAEPALRELIGARLKRGKVEVRGWIEGRQDNALRAPSVAELQRLIGVQDQIRAWLPTARELTVAEAMHTLARSSPTPAGLTDAVQALAQQLLDDFTASREREGARLTTMLVDRVAQLRALALQAQPMVPALVEQQRLRFLERWNEALGTAQADTAAQAAQERALT